MIRSQTHTHTYFWETRGLKVLVDRRRRGLCSLHVDTYRYRPTHRQVTLCRGSVSRIGQWQKRGGTQRNCSVKRAILGTIHTLCVCKCLCVFTLEVSWRPFAGAVFLDQTQRNWSPSLERHPPEEPPYLYRGPAVPGHTHIHTRGIIDNCSFHLSKFVWILQRSRKFLGKRLETQVGL